MSRRGGGTAALLAGSLLSGLLAYVLFATTTRALGAEAAAPVSVLWSWWGFAGAAVTFPVQHWVTRSVTAHGEGAVRRDLAGVWAGTFVLALVVGGVAGLGRETLFASSGWWFPAMAALVTVGSAAIGLVRGALTAWGRYAAVAGSLVLENGVRCVLVGALMVADVRSPVAYGAALVAGHAVVLVWPRALLVGGPRRPVAGRAGSPFRFLAGAGSAQLIAQLVLTGGPVLLALSSAPRAQVTALFATLALFRAPYQVGLGAVGAWNARVTRLVLASDARALRLIQRLTVLAGIGLCGAAWVVAVAAGPQLVQLVFGEEVRLAEGQVAAAAVGCALALVNLVATVTALARGVPVAASAAWATGIVAAVVASLLVEQPVDRVLTMFVAAEATAFAGLVLVRPRVRAVTG